MAIVNGTYCSATTNNLALKTVNSHLMQRVREDRQLRKLLDMLNHSTLGDNHCTIIYDEKTELTSSMQALVDKHYQGITAVSSHLSVWHRHDYSYIVLNLNSNELSHTRKLLDNAFNFHSDFDHYMPHITLLAIPKRFSQVLERFKPMLLAFYDHKLVHRRYDFNVPKFEALEDD